jgi:hypothetical protein
MKDYLKDSGVSVSPATPRQVIKEAFVPKDGLHLSCYRDTYRTHGD